MAYKLICPHCDTLRSEFTSALIGRLIMDLDKHRPLGTNGKHGDLHTDTCGCDPT